MSVLQSRPAVHRHQVPQNRHGAGPRQGQAAHAIPWRPGKPDKRNQHTDSPLLAHHHPTPSADPLSCRCYFTAIPTASVWLQSGAAREEKTFYWTTWSLLAVMPQRRAAWGMLLLMIRHGGRLSPTNSAAAGSRLTPLLMSRLRHRQRPRRLCRRGSGTMAGDMSRT